MRGLAASLAVLLVVSSASHGRGERAEPPVIAVREFLAAVKSRDCARAWTYFSAASRTYIDCKSREMIASAPYYAESFSAQNLYCLPTAVHRYHSYVGEMARLKSQSGDQAIVRLERRDSDGFLLPGSFPTRTRSEPVEIELTQENSRWAINVHASASGPTSRCPAPMPRAR